MASVHEIAFDEMRQLVLSDMAATRKLAGMLRYLAKYRSRLLADAMLRAYGPVVQSGPFAGMRYVERGIEGGQAPRLIGCYEAALHAHIEAAVARGYDTVLNIGCAEGYYAVGMARRLPQAQVIAADIDERAQAICRRMAAENDVAGRVATMGEFTGADFAAQGRGRTLVLCDIEGAEIDLLDPHRFPALRGMDVIVELHGHDVTRTVSDRFRMSHDVTVLEPALQSVQLPDLLRNTPHLDQLLATWEWRRVPTPWGVYLSRNPEDQGAGLYSEGQVALP